MSDASAKKHLFAEEANFWLHVFPDLAQALEGEASDGRCGDDVTSAADNLNFSKLFVLITIIYFSLYMSEVVIACNLKKL